MAVKFAPQDFIKRYVNVEIPARDRTILRADVYMPVGAGPFPAVVMRSPYLKSPVVTPHYSQWGRHYASHGFAFVMCDVRGRGDSDGNFQPFFNEVKDGYDTVEWVASQSWCTGAVGMDGNSYNAHTAWMAAKSGAPHMKAMTVSGVPGDLLRHGVHYLNGIKSLYMALWIFMTSGRNMQIPVDVYGMEKPYEFLPNLLQHCLQVPVEQIPEVLGFDGRDWIESLAHPMQDSFWDELQVQGKMVGNQVAGLHITGWFDNNLPGTIDWFDILRKESVCPEDQYLIVGPWSHAANVAPIQKVGDLEFGENALIDMLDLKVRFFDHYLKGEAGFVLHQVQLYDMGRMNWYQGADYPGTRPEKCYLADGKIASKAGGSSAYSYNPHNPTPVTAYFPPVNCAGVAGRPDVVRYQSEVRADPLTISGQVRFDLSIKIDAPSADLIATVCDRYPDGRCLPISFGGAKINGGEVRIELPRFHHTFDAGHRIELILQSAALPLYVPSRKPVRVETSGTSSMQIPVQED